LIWWQVYLIWWRGRVARLQGGKLEPAIVEADFEAGLPNYEKGVWGGHLQAVISNQLILEADRWFT
jgi:hypothetical protein